MSKASKKQSTPKKTTKQVASAPVRVSKTIKQRLPLRGYLRFTIEVFKLLKDHKYVFGRLLLIAWVASLLIVGITQQSEYSDLAASTEMFSEEFATGFYKIVVETMVIFVSVISGVLTSTLAESQQLYLGTLYIFLWLSTVWLLRQQLAGTEVQVRDALYSAGAPILTTLTIVVIALVQLLPMAIVATLLASAIASGVLSGVFGVVLSLGLIIAVGVLTLYWLTGTFFAAIVATIPGTYPWAALKSARSLIAGHRVGVLLRLLWLIALCGVVFAVTVLPVIFIDRTLNLSGSPLVPLVLQLVSTALYVYGAAYIYLLYRNIIDERS